MKKIYYSKMVVMVLSILIIIGAYLGPCEQKISKCIGGNGILVTRTLFHFSLALFTISPFLFFIRDEVFLKWFRFAGVWFFMAAILIILAPEYSSGIVGNPTKEIVSIWMGLLFVIMSFSIMIYKSSKLRGK